MQGTAQYISSFFHKASFAQPVKSACSAWVAPIAGLILLSGCMGVDNKPVTLPDFDTTAFSAMRLDARHLQIIENWAMPMQPPYIEHTLAPSPSEMVVDWASSVLVPIAGSGEVVLDIQRASVMVTDMPQSKALLDVFRDQQAYKIRVDLEADLSWIQPVGGKQAFIELSASAADTVEESASPNSFDIAIREVMQQAITQLDKEVRLKIAEIPEMTRP